MTMKVPSSALDLTCTKMKELITASATVQRKMKRHYKYSLDRQFGLSHLKERLAHRRRGRPVKKRTREDLPPDSEGQEKKTNRPKRMSRRRPDSTKRSLDDAHRSPSERLRCELIRLHFTPSSSALCWSSTGLREH